MLLKLITFLLLLRLTLLEITKLQLKFKLRWEDMVVERAKQCALPQEQKRELKRKSNHHKRRIS